MTAGDRKRLLSRLAGLGQPGLVHVLLSCCCDRLMIDVGKPFHDLMLAQCGDVCVSIHGSLARQS
jgi:hypothetical protein